MRILQGIPMLSFQGLPSGWASRTSKKRKKEFSYLGSYNLDLVINISCSIHICRVGVVLTGSSFFISHCLHNTKLSSEIVGTFGNHSDELLQFHFGFEADLLSFVLCRIQYVQSCRWSPQCLHAGRLKKSAQKLFLNILTTVLLPMQNSKC